MHFLVLTSLRSPSSGVNAFHAQIDNVKESFAFAFRFYLIKILENIFYSNQQYLSKNRNFSGINISTPSN